MKVSIKTTIPHQSQKSVADMHRGIKRLEERIRELKDFDVYSIRVARPPEIAALSISIQRTIEKYFGENTPDCHRFSRASRLNSVNPYVMEVDLQLSDYKTDVKNNIFHSIAILEQAIKTLIEDIEDENQIIVDPDASVLKVTVS